MTKKQSDLFGNFISDDQLKKITRRRATTKIRDLYELLRGFPDIFTLLEPKNFRKFESLTNSMGLGVKKDVGNVVLVLKKLKETNKCVDHPFKPFSIKTTQ